MSQSLLQGPLRHRHAGRVSIRPPQVVTNHLRLTDMPILTTTAKGAGTGRSPLVRRPILSLQRRSRRLRRFGNSLHSRSRHLRRFDNRLLSRSQLLRKRCRRQTGPTHQKLALGRLKAPASGRRTQRKGASGYPSQTVVCEGLPQFGRSPASYRPRNGTAVQALFGIVASRLMIHPKLDRVPVQLRLTALLRNKLP